MTRKPLIFQNSITGGPELSEVIFKDADHPTGVNLTHVVVKLPGKTVTGSATMTYSAKKQIELEGLSNIVTSFNTITIQAPSGYIINKVNSVFRESTDLFIPIKDLRFRALHSIDRKKLKITATGKTFSEGEGEIAVGYSLLCTAEDGSEESYTWHKNWRATKTLPTCTSKGYTTYTCENCNDSYKDSFIPALGHTPGDWLYSPAPTELKSGIRYRTCTVCDKTTTTEAVFPTTAVNKSYFNLFLDRDSNYTVSAADVANMPSVVCLPMTDGDTPNTGTTVTHVYERGFGYCESLEELYIPANYTYINDSAFYSCSNLRKVVFDNDCKISSIGRSAFAECTSLEVCSLPSTINYIGSNAFTNTNNLIIYCESASKPAGWADDWVDDTVTVVWGCGCAYNEHDFVAGDLTSAGQVYTCSKCNASYTKEFELQDPVLTAYLTGTSYDITITNNNPIAVKFVASLQLQSGDIVWEQVGNINAKSTFSWSSDTSVGDPRESAVLSVSFSLTDDDRFSYADTSCITRPIIYNSDISCTFSRDTSVLTVTCAYSNDMSGYAYITIYDADNTIIGSYAEFQVSHPSSTAEIQCDSSYSLPLSCEVYYKYYPTGSPSKTVTVNDIA